MKFISLLNKGSRWKCLAYHSILNVLIKFRYNLSKKLFFHGMEYILWNNNKNHK